jgi:hypothetical protein
MPKLSEGIEEWVSPALIERFRRLQNEIVLFVT